MNAVIFVGPTLPPRRRPTDPRLHWLAPVKQGELYRVALGHPEAIGIVDGYFEVVPTVWHKEILWAMAQGIHVFGAASIGALRAAELDVFGMHGVGRIYEAYRDGTTQDDDEVAVLHGPEELGYPSLTEAMVNIRATLERAVEDGIVSPELGASLTDIAKARFYKERTYETVLHDAADAGLPAAPLHEFQAWLPTGKVDQKRLDTLAMLDSVCEHLTAGAPAMRVSYQLSETVAWEEAHRAVDADLRRQEF